MDLDELCIIIKKGAVLVIAGNHSSKREGDDKYKWFFSLIICSYRLIYLTDHIGYGVSKGEPTLVPISTLLLLIYFDVIE